MVKIQPPIAVTMIVSAGRIEWLNASVTNVQFQPTVVLPSCPPLSGNHPSLIAKSQIASNASQKYGNADVITNNGGKAPSSTVPRRQAETSPIAVPSTKATIVVTPTSASVHGSACSTWWATVSGKNVSEVPK